MSKSNPYYHYDVFISYKSEDYEKSKMIYDFLTSEGLKVFLSKESLPRRAVSQYRKEIDSAMDRSHHMLVVCSDIKYLSTKWVEHEINWFSGEKLEGRKSDSNIILLISKEMFETEVLKNNKIFFPECLRQEQIYSLGDGDYKKDILQYFRCDDNLEESIPQKGKNTNDNFVNKTGRKRVVIATLLLVSAITLILLGLCVSKAIESFNSPDKSNPGGMGDNTPGVYDDTKTHILFGTYPQSRVTNSALVDELNSKEINWISYKYYSGNSNFDGSMAACDIAFYADIKYKGEKYRAVRFDEYRPVLTSERRMSESEGKNTDQFRNGYKTNEVYWFKYEPISWCVLDEKEGLVVSDFIIDAQPYVNVLYEGKDGKFYNRTGDYSNCWESSFLREWLNTELLENTFTSSEKKIIKDVTNYNDDSSGKETNDKIYILSADDWTNPAYGFMGNPDSYDELRAAYGTDYAKSQNLNIFTLNDEKYQYYIEKSYFSIRTEGKSTRNISYVDARGYILDYDFVNDTGCGVRPAMKINLDSKHIENIKKTKES